MTETKESANVFIVGSGKSQKWHAAANRGDLKETACGILVHPNGRGENGGDFYVLENEPLHAIDCKKCLKNIATSGGRSDKGFSIDEKNVVSRAIEKANHVPTLEELESLPRVYAVLLIDGPPVIREYYDHGIDWSGRRKIQARIPGKTTHKTSCQVDVYPTAYEAREAYLGKIRREIEIAESNLEAKRKRLAEDSKALEEIAQ